LLDIFTVFQTHLLHTYRVTQMWLIFRTP